MNGSQPHDQSYLKQAESPTGTKYNTIELNHGQSSKQNATWTLETLSQVLATSAKSLLLLCLGMLLGFPTVLIPVLMQNNDGGLHFTEEDSSWYGSLTYIFQPVGSILSGAMLQTFGCKRIMLFINIPQFGCWMMTYFATSNFVLYISSALVGFVIGLMEAPTIRYIGEISHPSLRGILTTYSSMYSTVGYSVVFFLGSLMNPHYVALCSSLGPIITFIALTQVPETPMWLMSKGRSEDALNSLQWLRGWTTAEKVKEEFDKLGFYSNKKISEVLQSYEKDIDTKDDKWPLIFNYKNCKGEKGDRVIRRSFSGDLQASEYKMSLAEKWKDLTRHEILKPLIICTSLHSFSAFSGLYHLRPYMINIFADMELPVQENWTSVWISLLGIFGIICCIFLINRFGKKPLTMISFAAVATCLAFLALHIRGYTAIGPWWPFYLFLAHYFFYNLALQPVSWIYLSEIFPYRGRGISSGIVVSLQYLVIFVGIKMYPTMLRALGLDGIFLMYAVISACGIIFTWFVLPETEGKFLSDIEIENNQIQQNCKSKIIPTA